MIKHLFVLLFAIIATSNLFAQSKIDVSHIEIVRDDFGIPHIFTETDAEAVYGIAWAQCEDNFHIMQDNYAMTKNRAGRLMGKDGAVLDYIYGVFEIEAFVESRYAKDIDPKMENFLMAYCEAVNKYAETHPKEVKSKALFPLTPKEVLGNHVLHFLLMHSSAYELGKLLTKDMDYILDYKMGSGSNAMAYSPNITTDQKTYLVANPHQPVNTMGNFWEVSVHSKEGYDMYGATFSVGGLFLAVGANRNLGWTHTTNYQNSCDVYKLEMNPNKKLEYKYDGKWIPLEVKKLKLKAKVSFLNIPVSKTYYQSVYGPVFEKESGFYAFKSHVFHNLKAPEQWYKMGTATNFDEFQKAVDIQGLSAQTITYADKDGTIYHLSNFAQPYRNQNYDWTLLLSGDTPILPGNTSESNWNLDSIHPIKDLAQVKNPKGGYVYNCNNTVFRMTSPGENPKPEDFPISFGMLRSNTIRANTFERLISTYDKVSFEDVRKIREDVSTDKVHMSFRNCTNCDDIPMILGKYPELAPSKVVFDKWNSQFTIDNKQAPIIAVSSVYLEKYLKSKMGNEEKAVPEDVIVKAFVYAQDFLMKHYGALEVPLGDIQKAVRYGVEYPMYGGPNTLANAHFMPYGKDKFEIKEGDSFVFYAKFGKDGLEELNTINAFGNSLKEGNPHSTDQLKMYVEMKTKPTELNLDILRKKGTAYHPE